MPDYNATIRAIRTNYPQIDYPTSQIVFSGRSSFVASSDDAALEVVRALAETISSKYPPSSLDTVLTQVVSLRKGFWGSRVLTDDLSRLEIVANGDLVLGNGKN